MAITYYKFKKPLNVSDLSEVDLGNATLFAEKKEVPADHKIKLTPRGYRDEYTLVTKVDRSNGREDTVGEIQVKRRGGKSISSYEGGWDGASGGMVEREVEAERFFINAERDTFILSRPNVLDGGKGIRIDGIIQYERS